MARSVYELKGHRESYESYEQGLREPRLAVTGGSERGALDRDCGAASRGGGRAGCWSEVGQPIGARVSSCKMAENAIRS